MHELLSGLHSDLLTSCEKERPVLHCVGTNHYCRKGRNGETANAPGATNDSVRTCGHLEQLPCNRTATNTSGDLQRQPASTSWVMTDDMSDNIVDLLRLPDPDA